MKNFEFDNEPIRVWEYRDAPEWMRKLSWHGGDEDWVALLPPNTSIPFWADTGTNFGICETQEVNIEEGEFAGYTVLIGAHS